MPILLQWTLRCKCGHDNGVFNQHDRPTVKKWPCGACGSAGGRWVRLERAMPQGMFMAEPEIPPHYNTSLGCKVESRSHLKALQAQHGCMDAVVKGDASKTMVPRDLDTKAKYYDSLRNQDAAGFSAVDAHGGAE